VRLRAHRAGRKVGGRQKPRTEQDQIGRRPARRSLPPFELGRTARPKPPGRSLDLASDGEARGMVVRPQGRQNSAYGLLRFFAFLTFAVNVSFCLLPFNFLDGFLSSDRRPASSDRT